MDAKKLEPLREMAKKWPHEGFNLRGERIEMDAAWPEETRGICHAKDCRRCLIDAFCDAAEVWLKEQYPYATKTRRVLIGEKKP